MVPGTRSIDGGTGPAAHAARAPAVGGDGDVLVIVEVHPKQEKFALYLDLAKGLKPILEEIDGFIDNERFESIRPAGLDPVALNLARREIRGEVADGREASRHPAARPGLGVSGLPFAGG